MSNNKDAKMIKIKGIIALIVMGILAAFGKFINIYGLFLDHRIALLWVNIIIFSIATYYAMQYVRELLSGKLD